MPAEHERPVHCHGCWAVLARQRGSHLELEVAALDGARIGGVLVMLLCKCGRWEATPRPRGRGVEIAGGERCCGPCGGLA